jgi:hypothetical protein
MIIVGSLCITQQHTQLYLWVRHLHTFQEVSSHQLEILSLIIVPHVWVVCNT